MLCKCFEESLILWAAATATEAVWGMVIGCYWALAIFFLFLNGFLHWVFTGYSTRV